MSESLSKSVWVVKQNDTAKGKFTNVLLSDEKWYGLGAEFADVKEGDGIQFEYTKNARGYLNADSKTVVIHAGKGQKQPEDKKRAAAAASGGAKKTWPPKSADPSVQVAIMAQSAQKAAADVVVACINADKLKIPAAKKDQYDAITGYMDILTDVFLAKTVGIMLKVQKGTKLEDIISTVPVTVSDSFQSDTDAVVAEDPAPVVEAESATDDFVETEDTVVFD
jgi:hypothetical protein